MRDLKMHLSPEEAAEAERLSELRIVAALRVVGYSKIADKMSDYVCEEMGVLSEHLDRERIYELDEVNGCFETEVATPLHKAAQIVWKALEEYEEPPEKKRRTDEGDGDDFGEELAAALAQCGDDFP